MGNNEMPCPTESAEQAAVMRWAQVMIYKWPCLKWLYHVPNEGQRSRITGGRMRLEGMKSGVADLCLPTARGKYHGLYIEMKRQRGNTPTEEQLDFLQDVSAEGYAACWCRGQDAAIRVITEYLEKGTMTYTPGRGNAGAFIAGEGTNLKGL